MKVLVVGAGAAGLTLAALLAESDRPYDVTVIERGRPSGRPGFGITVRKDAFSTLDLGRFVPGIRLEGRAFVFAGATVIDLPNPPDNHLMGFPRAAFIDGLTTRCRSAGVDIRYDTDVASLSESDLADYELVVGADGADSALRRRFESAFRPNLAVGANWYGWFGAAKPLPKLTILVPAGGAALAWGYMHTEDVSTLIVECTEGQFRAAGFDHISGERTAAALSEMFEVELAGAPVSCGTSVRWTRFVTVTNQRLRHRNIALVGDAAHTTHFSQGFGTMFALDDVVALHSALEANGSAVEQALEVYEAQQQPKIAEFQEVASVSMRWSESLLRAVERADASEVRELIAARWSNNAVTPAPLDSTSRSGGR